MRNFVYILVISFLISPVFAIPRGDTAAGRIDTRVDTATGSGRVNARVEARQNQRASYNTPPSRSQSNRMTTAGSSYRGVVPYRSQSQQYGSPYEGSYYSPTTGLDTPQRYPKTATGLNISYPRNNYQLPYTTRDSSGVQSGMPEFEKYRTNKILAQTYSSGIDLRPFTENIKDFEYYLEERNLRTPKDIRRQRDTLSKKYRIDSRQITTNIDRELGTGESRQFRGDPEEYAADDDTINSDDVFKKMLEEHREAGLDAKVLDDEEVSKALDGENLGIEGVGDTGEQRDIKSTADTSDKGKMRKIARSELGEYESFAGYSDDKFNSYMKKAEEFMDNGEFYKAADSYSLASLFRKNDPLVYAGRSLALLGAGEYMSSSYYLNKALMLYPDYITVKVDLVEMLGDRDVLENRIVDIQRWLARSGSGELSFLLAYIYYQMDEPEWSKEELEKAAGALPFKKTSQLLAEMVGADISKPEQTKTTDDTQNTED